MSYVPIYYRIIWNKILILIFNNFKINFKRYFEGKKRKAPYGFVYHNENNFKNNSNKKLIFREAT
jgi:hypothetical protein